MQNETVNFKVGDKVQKKSLFHTPADDTVFTIVRIEKTYLENGYYDEKGFFIYTGGTSNEYLMIATLSDGSLYNLLNLIKV